VPAAPAAPVTAREMDAGITAPQPLPEPPPPAARVVPPPPAPVPAPMATTPAAPADGTVILPSEAPPPPPPARAATAATPAAKAAAAATAEPVVARTVVLALAKLVAVDADLGAPEFPLQPLSFIGRTPDNQVRLNRPAVSRRHAQITQTDKGWTIKDLQSENGTYVNGERVQERPLADGDRVQIGTVRLLFRAG
jgi:hypothetical protein